MKLEKFYLDVITVFPYEIFYLLFENEEERKRSKFYLGAIRALRGVRKFCTICFELAVVIVCPVKVILLYSSSLAS